MAKIKIKQESLPQVVEDSVIENSKEVKKPSIMEGIAKAGLEVAKAALPTALSAIPVAGPVLGSLAQKLMSTMNDDEWFEEFSCAGATFNEMLKNLTNWGNDSYVATNVKVETLVAAAASYSCQINLGPRVKENVFPAFLAYIRSKTNNVLVDDTDKYWYAISDTIQLYAIYYTIRKYIKFQEHLPLNAPTLPDVLVGASPLILSQLNGIADSLRDFLKESTGIPYALASYLRWRFGTAFLSENSARAGIIFHDIRSVTCGTRTLPTTTYITWCPQSSTITPAQLATTLVNELTASIGALKNDILLQGRANADITLAFKDHQIKYDVEERHYDEKEFNLRCNCNLAANQPYTTPTSTVRLLLDSRLKVNTAIQSVTLSTLERGGSATGTMRTSTSGDSYNFGDLAFIHVNDCRIVSNVYGIDGPILNELYTLRNRDTYWLVLDNNATCLTRNGGTAKYPTVGAIFSYDINTDEITFENAGIQSRFSLTTTAYYVALAYRILAISLQMHYNDVIEAIGICIPNATVIGDMEYVQSAPLAYDIAMITDTQLQSIQRQALRNLFRGNYTRKTSTTPAVADAVKEVVDVATDDVKVTL